MAETDSAESQIELPWRGLSHFGTKSCNALDLFHSAVASIGLPAADEKADSIDVDIVWA